MHKKGFLFLLAPLVILVVAVTIFLSFFLKKGEVNTNSKPLGGVKVEDNRKLALPDWQNSALTNESNLVNYFYSVEDPIKQVVDLAAPNTMIRYTNNKEGVFFDVPYNQQWLDKKSKVNPYDEKEGIVVFGPVSIVEGGGAARYHTMRIVPQKNVEEIIAGISDSKSKEIVTYKISNKGEPKISKINGLTVVTYEDGNMAGGAWYVAQIVGKKNNYEFRVDGTWGVPWSNMEKLPAYVESIIKSFRLDS